MPGGCASYGGPCTLFPLCSSLPLHTLAPPSTQRRLCHLWCTIKLRCFRAEPENNGKAWQSSQRPCYCCWFARVNKGPSKLSCGNYVSSSCALFKTLTRVSCSPRLTSDKYSLAPVVSNAPRQVFPPFQSLCFSCRVMPTDRVLTIHEMN